MAIWGLLWSHKNFKIVLFSMKNVIGILIGIEFLDCFDGIEILRLILPSHDHRIPLYLFVSSSISFFHQCLIVFSLQVFTSLVKDIPTYFIIFDAIVSVIVFLFFIPHSLFLVYRNATYFCILKFYPTTLLNSFTSFNSIFVCKKSLGFLYILLHAKNNNFIFLSDLDAYGFCLFVNLCSSN